MTLLHTLLLVAVLGSTSRRRAGVRGELEGLVLVEREILVTNEATVAKGDN
jgi:hypothetical protein